MLGKSKPPEPAKEKDFKIAPQPGKPAVPQPVSLPQALKEPRLVSLDAFRGAVMLLMASAGFGMAKVVKNLEAAGAAADDFGLRTARFWAWQLEHVAWTGGVLWDMIQPAFMFMVGAALPYSYARRAALGQSYFGRLTHAAVRAVALVLLGVFLSSRDDRTNWIFPNVLAQIGLGYLFVFVLVNKPRWLQVGALVLVLGASWYAFRGHPLPSEGFDYATVGVPSAEQAECVLPGDFGHWSKNTNFAAEQDRVILNWFPRSEPFVFNSGGYATLNFVPSIATMLLGLMAGELLRSNRTPKEKLARLLAAGVVCLALGLAAGYTVCPIVKRIWTPSWALYSGGYVLAALGAFYALFDVAGFRRLALPLAVVGTNSFLVYMMSQWLKPWTARTLHIHLDEPYRKFTEWLTTQTGYVLDPRLFGGASGPIFESLGVLCVFWIVCAWLYRQRLFVRL